MLVMVLVVVSCAPSTGQAIAKKPSVKAPTTGSTCIDSDGGIEPKVSGKISYPYALNVAGEKIYVLGPYDDGIDVDECRGSTLAERYCDVSKDVNATSIIRCPNGCSNGACK